MVYYLYKIIARLSMVCKHLQLFYAIFSRKTPFCPEKYIISQRLRLPKRRGGVSACQRFELAKRSAVSSAYQRFVPPITFRLPCRLCSRQSAKNENAPLRCRALFGLIYSPFGEGGFETFPFWGRLYALMRSPLGAVCLLTYGQGSFPARK